MTQARTPLRFYADTHIPKAVTLQLRSRGVDIVRCEEVGLAEADDLTHLGYATQQGRALVSRDTDFLRHHSEWMSANKQHGGIFFVQDHLQGEKAVGVIVRTLYDYFELIAGGAATVEQDIANQVIYIR